MEILIRVETSDSAAIEAARERGSYMPIVDNESPATLRRCLKRYYKLRRPEMAEDLKHRMVAITAPKVIEILIQENGKTVWIYSEEGCLLRACQIEELILNDERTEALPHLTNNS